MFSGLSISSSALTAQRLRMDVISSNIANADSTRAKLVNGKWEPYQRKSVVLQPHQSSFAAALHTAAGNQSTGGVKVSKIVEDETTPAKLVYDPAHPDANEEGYVSLPNVDPLREMVDLLSTTRSYEANVTAFNASKAMMIKALEMGK